VKVCISDNNIPEENLVYLPTGDGICIALINIECVAEAKTPYDIHLRIALSILEKLAVYNDSTEDTQRRFQVRIGINENVDNLVTDINNRRNLAGDGINMAQRVMSLADGNQIFVAASVFATLRVREKYMDSAFRALPPTQIKHGVSLATYQFVDANYPGLNTNTPERFRTIQKQEPKLTLLAAYYFAHAIKNEPFFISKSVSGSVEYEAIILLYLLAHDSLESSQTTRIDSYEPKAPRYGANIEKQLEYFDSIDYWIKVEFQNLIIKEHLSQYYNYFQADRFGLKNRVFINASGKEKLKAEWPKIWEEFALDTDA
jgi:Adenylate and Guanylate cyclase catalytic domain